jgi:hypothetical protein
VRSRGYAARTGEQDKMALHRSMVAVLAFALALPVAGCSGYDVELKGGIFESLGVAGNLGKKEGDAKLKARPGLVVPPSTASLPKPGSAPNQVASAPGQSWPVDPEQKKAADKQARIAAHEAFCEKARKRVEDGIDTVVADGPMGTCHKSIIKSLTGKDLFTRKAEPQNAQ